MSTINILEPLGYPFFVKGLLAATIAGVLCGLVGVFVVLRRMSYIGHGLSHAIFGGAVASFLAGVNFYLGAGIWGFASAMMITRVARRRFIGADAAIGVITTASFAIGLALISRYGGFTRNFEAALFGSVLGVTTIDVIVIFGVLTIATSFVLARYRPLLFTTFDPDVAEASGVNTAWIDAAFSLVLAATIVATIRVLGVTLVAAALVIPAAVARMLTDRFSRMLWVAAGIGGACGAIGMYASWYLDVSSGAAIVLVATALFAVVFFATGVGAANLRPVRR